MVIVYSILGALFGILLILFLFAFFLHHKIFGKRWEPDGIIQYYDAKSYPELEVTPVVIPTKKGTLRGNFYQYPKEESVGILVFAHGMWGSHRAYLQEIELLARNGFTVLGFDYYGTELSDGKNIKGLGNSLKSLDAAVSYIKKAYPQEKIYVMGHSWGGFAALGIAKYHPDIERIVAMSPFISEFRIYKHLLSKVLYPLIPFILLIDSFSCGRYSFVHAKKVLKTTRVKTYILHSKDDTMVPYKISTEVLQKKLNQPNIQYEIVDNKRHNPDYSLEALEYTKEAFTELNSIKDANQKLEFRKNLDYHKMGELDENVFHHIITFLKKE